MGQSRSQTQSTGRRGTRHAVMRRPPEGRLPRMQHSLRRWWRNLLEQSPLWIVLFVLISTWCLLPDRIFFEERVEPGTIAARTYIADQDLSVPNEEATRELQEQAREKVLPVYDFDRSIEADRRRQLAVLFETGRLALAPPPESSEDSPEADGRPAVGPEPAASPALGAEDEDGSPGADLFARLGEASTFKIDESQVELLAAKEFSPEIEDRLTSILSRVLHQGVVSDKDLLLENRVLGITVQELPSGFRKSQLDLYDYLDYPEQVRRVVELDLLSWSGVRKKERAVFAEVVLANVAPNLTFNSSATLDLKNGAAAGVGTVSRTFRQGEVIARKGAKIDAGTARAIEQMAGTRDFRRLLLTGLGTFLMAAATTLLVWLMCGQGERRDRSRERMVSESLILLVLHLLGARLAYFIAEAIGNAIQREPFSSIESYVFAIPLASLALLAVLLYGRDAALVLSLVFALLVGHIVGTDAIWMMMVYALASSLAAVFALDHRQFKQRSAMTRAGAVVGLVNVAALLTLKAMSGEVTGGLQQLGFDLVCGFLGGLLAAAVASFAVPIFEGLFQITTSIKLIELANPNLPILRRLAFEAPGTFQHSLAVANLAKSGCEAIDGDSVLVNTGALYHDIGKIFRPRYFIENQQPGQNPHDKIQPSMSALILINHVKEGLELAYKLNLPQPILDAIEQHHGTRLIKFFYNRAQERCDPCTEAIREEEFRYPGPKPQSKEMGILMLADAVEAASRTLVNPGRQQLRNLLQALFDDCLQDGQLDHTDLTLGDLHKVEEAFLRVLTNIYHRRVDYPGFDFNRPATGEDRPRKRRPAKTGELQLPQAEAPPPAAAEPGTPQPAAGIPDPASEEWRAS
ncbi:MAG: HDIG domain-containing protein [bacterium]|nr:HDIG domain-containing protein [bacterium]